MNSTGLSGSGCVIKYHFILWKFFCKYLVDLDAVSLVSCIAITDGGLGVFVIDWSPSNAVLSVPQFQEIIWVARFVCGVCCVFMGGWFCVGLGCVKFGIGCRHFNVSMAIFSGRYGNLHCSIARFRRSVVMNE